MEKGSNLKKPSRRWTKNSDEQKKKNYSDELFPLVRQQHFVDNHASPMPPIRGELEAP